MIVLRRVRLVDWHFFQDVTIQIGESCLLAGENGSGKSTIIDAIQYAMAADLRKARFNAAAGDKKSGRDLAGYVRCKLGADTAEYLRDDAVAHVMLEFSDNESGFAACVCVEAFADGRMNERFWIGKGTKIGDVQVRNKEGTPLSSRAFRDGINASGVSLYDSKREYLKELTYKMGVFRRNAEYNPYLEALTRSVSFTPLVSVDKFVCDYILEDRPVDISTMKANLESYKEAEREAAATIERIKALKAMMAVATEWRQFEKLIMFQEYLKLKVDRDRVARRLAQQRNQESELVAALASLETQTTEMAELKRRLEMDRRNTETALARDDANLLYSRLEEAIANLDASRRDARSKVDRLDLLKTQCAALLGRSLGDDLSIEADTVDEERQYAAAAQRQANQARQETEVLLRDASTELSELEHGIHRYPEYSTRLRDALSKAGIEAFILADLAEISSPDWTDAVEGWLNSLRFAILVEPKRFKEALEIYDALPRNIGGAKLPNIDKMREAPVRQQSLATLVETESPYARIYLNYILGDVMTSDLGSLKNYNKAVTKECMTYSNHTASRIKEDVYSRPFMGRAARERRREQLVGEVTRLRNARDGYTETARIAAEREEICGRVYKWLLEAAGLIPAVRELARIESDIDKAKAELAAIDTGSFNELKKRVQELESRIQEAETNSYRIANRTGETNSALANVRGDIDRFTIDLSERERLFAGFIAIHEELIGECEDYADERMKNAGLDDISSNYDSALKGFATRRDNAHNQYYKQTAAFNLKYNTLLPERPDDGLVAARLLERLEGSELPSYREKIEKAKFDAEREFKDHFISKLAELIEGARESFKEINETLKAMAFGHDQYRFVLEERQERRGQLEVVRKAAEIASVDGGLFAQLIDPAERAAAQALFDRILRSDLDSVELRTICDYRTYFTYDIKIYDAESIDPKTGKAMVLSLAKVIREKSGGEAQTPYYVAIAASFYRFYKEKPENTIRLVLFDEAFNRMDGERIAKMLEFFKKLRLQIVTAVPTNKIEDIAQYSDRINLVIRHKHSAFVRDFRVLGQDA